MATIAQIMAGIETRLDTIDGLRVNDVDPTQINPPAAWVGVPDIPDYRATFGAGNAGRFHIAPTVTVAVSAALDRVGQVKLAGYANPSGATSIAAAIEADRTLGGIVEECFVLSFRTLDIVERTEIGYYGGLFTLYVIALRT